MHPSNSSGMAIAVFALSLFALLSPALGMGEILPVGLTSFVLGAALVDRTVMQGRFSQLLGAQWEGRTSRQKQRVLTHEAGHFLAACQLDIPIKDYVLDPWQAFRKGYPGYGGVQLDDAVWQGWLEQGGMTRRDVERYSIMWMAGGVAEKAEMGNAIGDRDDRHKLQQLVSSLRCSGQLLDPGYMERWARLQARSLFEEQAVAYKVAVECMGLGLPVETCIAQVKAALVAVETCLP
ncbi:MAG: hypothetical protein AB4040_02120 [Synechococcus sp.]